MPEALLSNISSLIAKHQLAANKNGELFNIFNILRARRSEVNTHSRFIFELLNPQGSHGEKDAFARLFVKNLFPELRATVLPEKFTVQREDLTDKGRRVDLTIKSEGNYLIGIEMKIDATDQSRQLSDYYDELNHRKTASEKIKLAYLTLYGKKADTKECNLSPARCLKRISLDHISHHWHNLQPQGGVVGFRLPATAA